MIELPSRNRPSPTRNIAIIGIGGAGANVLDRLALEGVAATRLIAAHTDAQSLAASVAGRKIQLGQTVTRGIGSGGDPDVGRSAAEESSVELRDTVYGTDIVFVIAGLGGGTGSGSAPYIAQLARESGALVIAVVTIPFNFEGKRRQGQAADALTALHAHADAVICFENDIMGDITPPRAGIQSAFAAADAILSQSVRALSVLLERTGLIHLGFDDIRAALHCAAPGSLFGYGEAGGDHRAFDALEQALKNPLMDRGRVLRDCETVLVQVSGGVDMTLSEIQLLMDELSRHLSDNTRLLFGAAVAPELARKMAVTILSSEGAPRPVVVAPRVVESVVELEPVFVAPEPEPVVPEPEPEPEPIVPELVVEAEPEPEPVVFEPEPEPIVEKPVEILAEEFVEEPVEDPPVVIVAEESVEEPVEELLAKPMEAPPVAIVAKEPVAEPVEEPVKEQPPTPERPAFLIPRKPRGLRPTGQQSSLFSEEPSAPIQRVALPVPGRMLHSPFPAPKPAPVPEPEPAKSPAVPVWETETLPVAAKPAVAEPKIILPPEPPAVPTDMPPERGAPTPPPRPPIRRTITLPDPVLAASKAPMQEMMQFEPVTRGRFEKSEPTIVDGQDLDVPAYLRHRVKLK